MSAKIVLMCLVAAVVVTNIMAQGGIECPVNSIPQDCGRLCEPTCANPNPQRWQCPGIECTRATRACRCIQGYLRDDNGDCVEPSDCPETD